MKFLLVMDIASTSTREVGRGMSDGLAFLGHDVVEIALNKMVELLMRHLGKIEPGKVTPQQWGSVLAWCNDRILRAALATRPDVVLVITGWGVSVSTIEMLKEYLPDTKTVLYVTESPYLEEDQKPFFTMYDLILNNEMSNMATVEEHSRNAVYFPHSFNPNVHFPRPPRTLPGPDVFLCCTGFKERLDLLNAVDWGDAFVHVLGLWPDCKTYAEPARSFIQDAVVPNHTLAEWYGKCDINLNIHRTSKEWRRGGEGQEHIERADSLGPRVFEILACRGFLLTDRRAEMDGWLRDGVECATYSPDDPAGLGELVRFYLQRPEERERIAAAGHAAVQRCTFAARITDILLPRLEVI